MTDKICRHCQKPYGDSHISADDFGDLRITCPSLKAPPPAEDERAKQDMEDLFHFEESLNSMMESVGYLQQEHKKVLAINTAALEVIEIARCLFSYDDAGMGLEKAIRKFDRLTKVQH